MKNQLKTLLLLGVLSSLLVGVGSLLGPGYAYTFAFFAIAMNFAAYFFSDRLVLRMHGAQEIPPGELPELRAMVQALAARMELPAPRLYFVDDPQPNAFATGRNPAHGAVAVTRGILELLDSRELRGVLAHELGHIKNRDVLVATVAAGIAGAISSLAHLLSFAAFMGPRDDDESGAGGLLAALVAPLLATLVQLGISRSREYLADESGAHYAEDPEALARALEKLEAYSRRIPSTTAVPATASLFIVNPFQGGLARLFSTHPPLEQRIARLRNIHPLRRGPTVWVTQD